MLEKSIFTFNIIITEKIVVTWMNLHYGSFSTNTTIKVPNSEVAYPALIIATEFGRLNIVKLFLRVGVDARTCFQALYVAANKGKLDIAEALLVHRCNVHGYEDGGDTSLKFALENRHDQLVRLLCKRGANLVAEEVRLNLSVVIGPKQVIYGILHKQQGVEFKKRVFFG